MPALELVIAVHGLQSTAAVIAGCAASLRSGAATSPTQRRRVLDTLIEHGAHLEQLLDDLVLGIPCELREILDDLVHQRDVSAPQLVDQ